MARRFDQAPPKKDGLRTNNQIRSPRVMLIAEDGHRLGEFLTVDAVALSDERGYDLIEVSPTASPPVCKLGDYGKIKYEQKKRQRKQVQVQLKEVKLRPKTDEHDLQVKSRHARRFLEAGDKVKITVRFRGREHAHRDIGAEQCQKLFDSVQDVGKVSQAPKMEGRQMFMLIDPLVSKAAQ